MKAVIVIPARYKSSRFPGKPLVDIRGKSLIQRTWERCTLAMPEESIYVATDDKRIQDHCRERGIQTVMTGAECLTGTDRVHQAAEQIQADIYVNVQGDEPLIDPGDITAVLEEAKRHPGSIINAMCPITDEADFRSPMIPKVVTRLDGRLLYFSRAPIPTNKEHGFVGAMRQVCVNAYDKAALDAFVSVTSKTPLEAVEDLELNRFLELGYEVRMIRVSANSIAVDTPADVAKVEAVLIERGE